MLGRDNHFEVVVNAIFVLLILLSPQILPVLFKDVAKETLASHSTVAAWGFTMTLANLIGEEMTKQRHENADDTLSLCRIS